MTTGLSVLCFLAHLPGPPHVTISNMTFQAYSINKRICPKFDPQRDTLFLLNTRNNPEIHNTRIIYPYDDDSLARSGIDFSRKTIIFFHGFLESYRADDAQSIKDGYLAEGNYNIILAQNERLLAGPDYFTAAKNCKPIARYAASFIDYLVLRGMDLQDLHVIGLSLGGQIAGMTGQFVKSGKLPRITALDPAGPLFNANPIDERLDPSDAIFVDVIYSNSGIFGMKYSTGHVNFWPNGGRKQPGCSFAEIIKYYGFELNWLVFCHHFRSYQLYYESIKSPLSFPSTRCTSYTEYKLGICNQDSINYLGVYANPQIKGDFYIDTGYRGVGV